MTGANRASVTQRRCIPLRHAMQRQGTYAEAYLYRIQTVPPPIAAPVAQSTDNAASASRPPMASAPILVGTSSLKSLSQAGDSAPTRAREGCMSPVNKTTHRPMKPPERS